MGDYMGVYMGDYMGDCMGDYERHDMELWGEKTSIYSQCSFVTSNHSYYVFKSQITMYACK